MCDSHCLFCEAEARERREAARVDGLKTEYRCIMNQFVPGGGWYDTVVGGWLPSKRYRIWSLDYETTVFDEDNLPEDPVDLFEFDDGSVVNICDL